MTNFILNEKEFAMVCYQYKTYEKNNIRRTLELIAQYLYQYLGIRKIKIPEILIDYLQQAYPRYKQDSAKWDETCAKIAKHTGGKTLLELDGVPIYQEEMETIKAIKDKYTQRLAFTMLCIAKLNHAKNPSNNGWLNLDSKAIFDAASVTGSAKARNLKLHDMQNLGLVEFPKKVNKTNIRITYMCTDDTAEKAMIVSDFRELGLLYQYEILHDWAIGKCSDCGRYFVRAKANKYRLASKICLDCIQKQEQMKPPKIVSKICVDCGKKFYVDARAQHKTRCNECQEKWRRKNDRKRKKKPEFSALEKPSASVQ